MNKIKNNKMKQFEGYIRRTWRQKVVSLGMIGVGILSTVLSGGDGTALVFISLFAVPTFFAKENILE